MSALGPRAPHNALKLSTQQNGRSSVRANGRGGFATRGHGHGRDVCEDLYEATLRATQHAGSLGMCLTFLLTASDDQQWARSRRARVRARNCRDMSHEVTTGSSGSWTVRQGQCILPTLASQSRRRTGPAACTASARAPNTGFRYFKIGPCRFWSQFNLQHARPAIGPLIRVTVRAPARVMVSQGVCILI